MNSPSLLNAASQSPTIVDISLENAIKDSPFFRASINCFEDEVEEFSKWLEGVQKLVKNYVETFEKLSELHISFSSKVSGYDEDGALDRTVLKHFSLTLQSLCPINQKFIDDLNNVVIPEISNFLKKDLMEIREARKYFEKGSEKYDAALAKYSALQKSKEISALREDSFQLYESRKIYLKAALDYSSKILFFRNRMSNFSTLQLLKFLDIHGVFSDSISAVSDKSQVRSSMLSEKLSKNIQENSDYKASLEKSRQALEQSAISKFKPQDTIGSSENLNVRTREKSSSLQALSTGNTKEGYLFKKSSPKISVATWNRKYFLLQDGEFSYCITSNTGKYRGVVVTTASINLLLCTIKKLDQDKRNDGRRFCFEVSGARKSFILQAETSEEMNEWIVALEKSKAVAEANSKGIEPASTATADYSDDEDADAKSLKEENLVLESSIDIQNGGASYKSASLSRKNDELHRLFKSVPAHDMVLATLNCSLQRDISIQGKMYITQNRICFHSSILGFVTVLIVHFNEVKDLVRKTNTIFNSIAVTAGNTQHLFRVFIKNDEKSYNVMKLAWNNSKQEQKLNAKDLLEKVQELSEETTPTEKSPLTGPKEQQVYPSGFEHPSAPLACDCKEHLEKIHLDLDLPISAQKLFEKMFSLDFCKSMYERNSRKIQELKDWDLSQEKPKRTIKAIIPVNNPMVKVKETDCIENVSVLQKIDYKVFVLESECETPNMTYGDSFTVNTRYCITYNGPDSCKLKLSIGVKFSKSPLVKGMIRSSGLKGLEENCADVERAVRKLVAESSSDSPLVAEICSTTPARLEPAKDYFKIGYIVLSAVLVLILLATAFSPRETEFQKFQKSHFYSNSTIKFNPSYNKSKTATLYSKLLKTHSLMNQLQAESDKLFNLIKSGSEKMILAEFENYKNDMK